MTNTIKLSISNNKIIILKKDVLELEIDAVDDIFNLDGLSTINHLHKLVIRNCTNLIDISILNSFNKLRHLEIENCPSISDLSPINNLENLKKIKCIGFCNLEILTTLKENIKVKKLDILQDRKWFTGFLDDNDIDLYIYFLSKKVVDLKPISSIQHCKKIGFHYCGQLEHIEGMEEVKELQEVSFYSCEKLKNLSPLSQLPKLNSLSIQNCNSLKIINKVLTNTTLQKLEVSECKNIRILNFPENNNFVSLKLHSNIHLQKICLFSHLKKLKTLIIEDCNSLEDIELIGTLENLEELGLFYNKTLISEGTLAQLNQLKSLRIWTAATKLNIL